MVILISFIVTDEDDKFEYIYHKYKKLMLHKAYSILKDYNLAEDAVSEACIRVYKNVHKIEDANSNKAIAFLMVITQNTSLTLLNKKQKHAVTDIPLDYADDFDLEESVVDSLSSEQIYDFVNELSEDLKTPFLLKYGYAYSHKEIAQTLGIRENHVAVRIHRAKKQLIQLLEKEGCKNE